MPFEKDFYQKYDVEVDFVGHPLLDVIPQFKSSNHWKKQYDIPSEKPIIALLPGSRKQEIKTVLMTMLEMVNRFKDYHFVIAAAPSQPLRFYHQFILDRYKEQVSLVPNATYDILSSAKAALVTSGTATLETALFDVPQVVCYKGNPISYQIAKRLVDVAYISLVNLIMEGPIVKELIQSEFTAEQLAEELKRILQTDVVRRMQSDYTHLRERLGNSGASERVAELIVSSFCLLYTSPSPRDS